MTDPAPDADRQEQLADLAPGTAEPAVLADDVPVADAVEQQQTAATVGLGRDDLSPEADEYDVLEQRAVVPDDEDDAPR